MYDPVCCTQTFIFITHPNRRYLSTNVHYNNNHLICLNWVFKCIEIRYMMINDHIADNNQSAIHRKFFNYLNSIGIRCMRIRGSHRSIPYTQPELTSAHYKVDHPHSWILLNSHTIDIRKQLQILFLSRRRCCLSVSWYSYAHK